MKQGRTWTDLTAELDRREREKEDWNAAGTAMFMNRSNQLTLKNGDMKTYDMLPLAHQQLAETLDIPKKYYDFLLEGHTPLLQQNVNYLLPKLVDRRLVRTLDKRVRAIMSDRFRVLDDAPFVKSITPPLIEAGFEVASAEVTDTRFYLKVVSNELMTEIKRGVTVRAGFAFRNSEVGHSRLAGFFFYENLACTNGAITTSEYAFARNHSSKALSFSDAVERYVSDESRRLEDEAYWAKLRDIVGGMVKSPEGFKAIVERIRLAIENKLEADPIKAVEKTAELFLLSKPETTGVMKYFLQGNDFSQWGLSNALTRYSQDVEDYDRATDFEMIGGKVIELNKRDWNAINTAA